MLVAYFMSPVDLQGGIYVPICLYLIHRSMIALKYATLSPSEYRCYQTCPYGPVLDEYISQAHLFSGWHAKNPVIIEYEIASAAARAGAPLAKLKLYMSPMSLEDEIDRWGTFVGSSFGHVKEEVNMGTTRHYVTVREACMALPTLAYDACLSQVTVKGLDYLARFYMLLNALLPLMRPEALKLMSSDSRLNNSERAWLVLYYVCAVPVTMLFSLVLMIVVV